MRVRAVGTIENKYFCMHCQSNNAGLISMRREVERAALAYVLDHPRWYVASVAHAMIDFFSPPLRMIAEELNVVRQRSPALWLTLSSCGVLVALGFVALFMRVPLVVKLGPAVLLVSALGTSLTAHTENRRLAAPIVPLVMMNGVAAFHLVAPAPGIEIGDSK